MQQKDCMIQINKFEPGLVVFGRDREGTAQVPGPQVLSSRVGAQGSLPALSWIETWRSSIALPLSTAAVILQAPAHLIGCLVQFQHESPVTPNLLQDAQPNENGRQQDAGQSDDRSCPGYTPRSVLLTIDDTPRESIEPLFPWTSLLRTGPPDAVVARWNKHEYSARLAASHR